MTFFDKYPLPGLNPYQTVTVNLASKLDMFENHNIIVVAPTVLGLGGLSISMVAGSIFACNHLFSLLPFFCVTNL